MDHPLLGHQLVSNRSHNYDETIDNSENQWHTFIHLFPIGDK